MSKYNLGEMGQRLIELSGDLIAVSTKEGFFLALSRDWEDVLGYPIEEIRARTFMNFVHQEDQIITNDCLGSLTLGMEVRNFRNRYVTRDKSIVWLEWCALMETETGLIYSKARVLEPDAKIEKIYLEQNNAFQASKLAILGEMAAGVAHELNNPLAIIAGYLQIMDLETQAEKKPDEEQLKMIRAMLKATDRATRIVESLKSLSRDASSDSLQITAFEDIINNSIDLLGNRFERHHVSFTYAPVKEKVFLNAKKTELAQLFFNLMLNAFEASQKEPHPWIKLETSLEDHHLLITISNSGPTIPAEFRTKIFNPFFSSKSSGHGIGMGLSIASKVIHQHQGSICLDQATPYNRFIIKLPLADNKS